jgi:hypothetical protein
VGAAREVREDPAVREVADTGVSVVRVVVRPCGEDPVSRLAA